MLSTVESTNHDLSTHEAVPAQVSSPEIQTERDIINRFLVENQLSAEVLGDKVQYLIDNRLDKTISVEDQLSTIKKEADSYGKGFETFVNDYTRDVEFKTIRTERVEAVDSEAGNNMLSKLKSLRDRVFSFAGDTYNKYKEGVDLRKEEKAVFAVRNLLKKDILNYCLKNNLDELEFTSRHFPELESLNGVNAENVVSLRNRFFAMEEAAGTVDQIRQEQASSKNPELHPDLQAFLAGEDPTLVAKALSKSFRNDPQLLSKLRDQYKAKPAVLEYLDYAANYSPQAVVDGTGSAIAGAGIQIESTVAPLAEELPDGVAIDQETLDLTMREHGVSREEAVNMIIQAQNLTEEDFVTDAKDHSFESDSMKLEKGWSVRRALDNFLYKRYDSAGAQAEAKKSWNKLPNYRKQQILGEGLTQEQWQAQYAESIQGTRSSELSPWGRRLTILTMGGYAMSGPFGGMLSTVGSAIMGSTLDGSLPASQPQTFTAEEVTSYGFDQSDLKPGVRINYSNGEEATIIGSQRADGSVEFVVAETMAAVEAKEAEIALDHAMGFGSDTVGSDPVNAEGSNLFTQGARTVGDFLFGAPANASEIPDVEGASALYASNSAPNAMSDMGSVETVQSEPPVDVPPAPSEVTPVADPEPAPALEVTSIPPSAPSTQAAVENTPPPIEAQVVPEVEPAPAPVELPPADDAIDADLDVVASEAQGDESLQPAIPADAQTIDEIPSDSSEDPDLELTIEDAPNNVELGIDLTNNEAIESGGGSIIADNPEPSNSTNTFTGELANPGLALREEVDVLPVPAEADPDNILEETIDDSSAIGDDGTEGGEQTTDGELPPSPLADAQTDVTFLRNFVTENGGVSEAAQAILLGRIARIESLLETNINEANRQIDELYAQLGADETSDRTTRENSEGAEASEAGVNSGGTENIVNFSEQRQRFEAADPTEPLSQADRQSLANLTFTPDDGAWSSIAEYHTGEVSEPLYDQASEIFNDPNVSDGDKERVATALRRYNQAITDTFEKGFGEPITNADAANVYGALEDLQLAVSEVGVNQAETSVADTGGSDNVGAAQQTTNQNVSIANASEVQFEPVGIRDLDLNDLSEDQVTAAIASNRVTTIDQNGNTINITLIGADGNGIDNVDELESALNYIRQNPGQFTVQSIDGGEYETELVVGGPEAATLAINGNSRTVELDDQGRAQIGDWELQVLNGEELPESFPANTLVIPLGVDQQVNTRSIADYISPVGEAIEIGNLETVGRQTIVIDGVETNYLVGRSDDGSVYLVNPDGEVFAPNESATISTDEGDVNFAAQLGEMAEDNSLELSNEREFAPEVQIDVLAPYIDGETIILSNAEDRIQSVTQEFYENMRALGIEDPESVLYAAAETNNLSVYGNQIGAAGLYAQVRNNLNSEQQSEFFRYVSEVGNILSRVEGVNTTLGRFSTIQDVTTASSVDEYADRTFETTEANLGYRLASLFLARDEAQEGLSTYNTLTGDDADGVGGTFESMFERGGFDQGLTIAAELRARQTEIDNVKDQIETITDIPLRERTPYERSQLSRLQEQLEGLENEYRSRQDYIQERVNQGVLELGGDVDVSAVRSDRNVSGFNLLFAGFSNREGSVTLDNGGELPTADNLNIIDQVSAGERAALQVGLTALNAIPGLFVTADYGSIVGSKIEVVDSTVYIDGEVFDYLQVNEEVEGIVAQFSDEDIQAALADQRAGGPGINGLIRDTLSDPQSTLYVENPEERERAVAFLAVQIATDRTPAGNLTIVAPESVVEQLGYESITRRGVSSSQAFSEILSPFNLTAEQQNYLLTQDGRNLDGYEFTNGDNRFVVDRVTTREYATSGNAQVVEFNGRQYILGGNYTADGTFEDTLIPVSERNSFLRLYQYDSDGNLIGASIIRSGSGDEGCFNNPQTVREVMNVTVETPEGPQDLVCTDGVCVPLNDSLQVARALGYNDNQWETSLTTDREFVREVQAFSEFMNDPRVETVLAQTLEDNNQFYLDLQNIAALYLDPEGNAEAIQYIANLTPELHGILEANHRQITDGVLSISKITAEVGAHKNNWHFLIPFFGLGVAGGVGENSSVTARVTSTAQFVTPSINMDINEFCQMLELTSRQVGQVRDHFNFLFAYIPSGGGDQGEQQQTTTEERPDFEIGGNSQSEPIVAGDQFGVDVGNPNTSTIGIGGGSNSVAPPGSTSFNAGSGALPGQNAGNSFGIGGGSNSVTPPGSSGFAAGNGATTNSSFIQFNGGNVGNGVVPPAVPPASIPPIPGSTPTTPGFGLGGGSNPVSRPPSGGFPTP
jgi:hypothetical protein